jgi:hypothetical protein
MITTLVLLIVAVRKLELANMKLLTVMIAMHAQLTAVMPPMVVLTVLSFANQLLVRRLAVILLMDVNILL